MHHTEEQEQIALMQWAKLQENVYPELAMLFHIPNGGKRSRTEAARFKAAGVKAGVPDLFLPVPRGNYHGLWIEMKIKPNKPTQNQLDWIFNLRERNYACEICYSFLEASEAILRYLKNQT